MDQLINLDNQLSQWAYQFIINKEALLAVVKFLAVWLVYLVPIVLIILWFWPPPQNKKKALIIFFSGILAWLVLAKIIGFLLPRIHPSFPDLDVRDPLFHRPEKSFPSDHAALLFATVFALFFEKLPKLAWLFLFVAIIASLGRYFVGLHFMGDVFGGLLVGLMGAYIIIRIRYFVLKYLVEPLIWIATKIGL